MYKYIEKILSELPLYMNWTLKTSVANYLENPKAKKLPEDKAQQFHHLVAKLLHPRRCTQQDTQTTVSFLYTRLQMSYEVDYKKLTKVFQYLRNNSDLTLTVELRKGISW